MMKTELLTVVEFVEAHQLLIDFYSDSVNSDFVEGQQLLVDFFSGNGG